MKQPETILSHGTLADQVDRLSDAEARSILREIVAAIDRPTVVWSLRVLAVEQIVERMRSKGSDDDE